MTTVPFDKIVSYLSGKDAIHIIDVSDIGKRKVQLSDFSIHNNRKRIDTNYYGFPITLDEETNQRVHCSGGYVYLRGRSRAWSHERLDAIFKIQVLAPMPISEWTT